MLSEIRIMQMASSFTEDCRADSREREREEQVMFKAIAYIHNATATLDQNRTPIFAQAHPSNKQLTRCPPASPVIKRKSLRAEF